MNKSLEAALRGYIVFRVNGALFWTYNAAQKCRTEQVGAIDFTGLHIFKGWRSFYIRVVFSTPMTQPLSVAEELEKARKYFQISPYSSESASTTATGSGAGST